MQPIAVVTPWWGKELKGGAEQQAYQVATRLAARGHRVEVLTTCCRAFQDNWEKNYYRSGVTREAGLKVRRFPVNKRDAGAFDRANSVMLGIERHRLKIGVSPVSAAESAIFAAQNINSDKLLHYLRQHARDYRAFIFLPYLYGIILNGLPFVAERAYLQPCLHDEVYAYLPEVADIFHRAKGLLFISEGEAQLARKLFGPGIHNKSIVAGAGVEVNLESRDIIEKIGNFAPQQEAFILCLGRRDSTKNTDLLVRAYTIFKEKYPDSLLKLVLAGPGNVSYQDLTVGIVDLGLVEEAEKIALLENCQALFQPSRNESYSRVIMEAWFKERPVAAHRDCLATAMAVSAAGGGWLAETEAEWAEVFATVDCLNPLELSELGKRGYIYAENCAVWDKVMERYEGALGLLDESASSDSKSILLKLGTHFFGDRTPIQTVSSVPRKLQAIHQLLPNFSYGDAISNQALNVRQYLRNRGYESEIFVRYVEERVLSEVKLLTETKLDANAGLLYHHSIGSEVTPLAISHPAPKGLIYHNITPAEFFHPFDPQFAQLLEGGRQELSALATAFSLSVGDSAYNASELAAAGFQEPSVLPIIVDPGKWDIAPDTELMERLQDGERNLLFVGRIAPNKKQDDLVRAFAEYLTMDSGARLILVGWGSEREPYYCYLLKLIEELGLQQRVWITGKVNDAQLLAFYRTAHLFWSMSEHEGFGVPLVEAMWFDIPVLAYKSSAVPETLQGGGVMFFSKDNLLEVAALAKILVWEREWRDRVVKSQRKERDRFLLANVRQDIDRLIHQLEQS
ncbi:glycosyltransferase [Oscillatoria sp. FACHB-1406]|uniref:glycosyltransferase family 4 protein n=1 Tax=Oscillatoria sp. FACHB-1406 TaxID=2692846 RepID=UPI0016820AA1|nr:glycosyltransferase [Oscillatoria sp. FACHB-1406]MBD2577182.1 glycosyltransferase [Oscillatoria sp. FACHB-1406]